MKKLDGLIKKTKIKKTKEKKTLNSKKELKFKVEGSQGIKAQKAIFWERGQFSRHAFHFFLYLFAFSSLFSLLGLANVYADRFLPGTKVSGVALDNKTIEEASQVLTFKASEFAKKENTIKVADKEFRYTAEKAGINYSIDETISTVFNSQHDTEIIENFSKIGTSLYENYFKKQERKIAFTTEKQVQDGFIAEIKKQVDTLPINSVLVYSSGAFSATEDVSGVTLNAQELESALAESSQDFGKQTISLSLKTEKATIQKENAETSVPLAQALSDKKFTFIYNGKSYSAPKDTVASWVEFKTEGNKIAPSINQEKLSKYLATLKGVVRKTVDQQVSILNGQETTVRQGQAGVAVDMNQTMPKVLAQLDKSEISVELVTIQTEPKKVIVDTDEIIAATQEKYIDVDISGQWMTLFDAGGVVVARYRVSTGKVSMPTPLGWGKVSGKSPRAYSSKYGLYMPYWMAFKAGGYGIHELPEWPNGAKEGQNHLGIRVSHGCVRLGVGPAEMVYNWSPIGTPVYVHN